MQDRQQDLQRVVGFFEYMQALHHFDQLFRAATDDELRAIDDLVQQWNEFTIYSGLSLQFPNAASSSLASVWNSENALTRRGVHSLSALARLEIAAMLSGHLQRRAPIPSQLLPKPNEREAYAEFLRDAVLFHASSLAADAERSVSRPITQSDALTYERRIKQAERITRMFYQLAQGNLTRQELSELRRIQTGLAQIGDTVRGSLAIGTRLSNGR